MKKRFSICTKSVSRNGVYTNAHECAHLVLSHSATHVWTTYRGGNMSYKYVNRVTSAFVMVLQ